MKNAVSTGGQIQPPDRRPAGKEMPIFARTFDLLAWLLTATNHFPRSVRHSFTHRLLGSGFDLRERLEEANVRRGKQRMERLEAADEALACLRMYVRLAARLEWWSEGQYHHAAQMLDEIGRLLGGWRKATLRG